jgi:hypothetical protein
MASIIIIIIVITAIRSSGLTSERCLCVCAVADSYSEVGDKIIKTGDVHIT